MSSSRSRRWPLATVSCLAVLLAFMTVTSFTGLDAPGMLHRYRASELSELASAINADAGPYRTPDDCWRTVYGTDGPLRAIAGVDHLRSRVVVRTYARKTHKSEPATFNAIVERIDQIIRANPKFAWGMIQLEPSTDGWSPLVSCPLVTRGYRPVTKP